MRMLMTTLFVSLLAGNAMAGQELTVVVPNGLEEVEGNGGNDGVGALQSETGTRYQVVYDASQFASLPSSHHMISALRYRPDGNLDFPYWFLAPETIVRLSTTSKAVGALSRTFSANTGPDEMIVIQGDTLFETANIGPPGGPKEFDLGGFPFLNNFPYDPSKGNLLLDITVRGRTVSGGFDNHDSYGPGQWLFAPTPDAPTALWSGRTIGVTQFTFVPEPSALMLAAIGVVAIVCQSRRRLLRGVHER